ncbi:MAG TPA: PadR family transcriptional regulator [Actinomycetota bacterium]|nr:PadR family transcriptional regulator [Actinomycetota bacterium]
MGEGDRRLPTTAYAVLGLLTFGEMSGYDLLKLAEESVGHFWSPAKSQVYAELRRLVAEGYATEREVEQANRPDKRLYRITPEGERALRAWLADPRREPEVIKSPGLLKVFFGHLVEPATLADLVERWREETLRLLAEFEQLERRIAGREDLLFPYLTLRNGLAHVRARLAWEEEVMRELRRRARRTGGRPARAGAAAARGAGR